MKGRPKLQSNVSVTVTPPPDSNVALDFLLMLRERSSEQGAWSLTFNDHFISGKPKEEAYAGKMDGVDKDSGIYRLRWHPNGATGGMVHCVSNTLGGLRKSAASVMKIDIGEDDNGKRS